jgi:hypothetical protein
MNYEQRTRSRLENAVRDIFNLLDADRSTIRFVGPGGAIRRRSMVKNIDLAAKHYDLRQEVDAYLAECDCASVNGLEESKLKALSNWLSGVMDRLSCVCDHPDVPPAR